MYLLRFVCQKIGKVLCFLYVGSYLCCDYSDFECYFGKDYVLYYCKMDEFMVVMYKKVVDCVNVLEVWEEKYEKFLDEEVKFFLKFLWVVFSEGEKILYELFLFLIF